MIDVLFFQRFPRKSQAEVTWHVPVVVKMFILGGSKSFLQHVLRTTSYKDARLQDCKVLHVCKPARLEGLKGWMQTCEIERIERMHTCKLEAYAAQPDGP